MKSYQIVLKNQTIEYDLSFKNMKSIRMRVQSGRLKVTAPYYTPLSFIEENILSYQDKLISQIQTYEPYAKYEEDGYVDIFGERYSIVLRDLGKRECHQHVQQLYVYHHDIQNCVETKLKDILHNYIEERIIGYLAYDFDLPMPRIEIKKYKGRWGSCYYRENKVSFNLSLVHLEKELIDYVIVHELAHFLQANHSSLFYLEIEKRMPDYKLRQKRLKEKHI